MSAAPASHDWAPGSGSLPHARPATPAPSEPFRDPWIRLPPGPPPAEARSMALHGRDHVSTHFRPFITPHSITHDQGGKALRLGCGPAWRGARPSAPPLQSSPPHNEGSETHDTASHGRVRPARRAENIRADMLPLPGVGHTSDGPRRRRARRACERLSASSRSSTGRSTTGDAGRLRAAFLGAAAPRESVALRPHRLSVAARRGG